MYRGLSDNVLFNVTEVKDRTTEIENLEDENEILMSMSKISLFLMKSQFFVELLQNLNSDCIRYVISLQDLNRPNSNKDTILFSSPQITFIKILSFKRSINVMKRYMK